MEKLEKQQCPVCGKNTLSLTEAVLEIPYFGKAFLFSMNCEECDYFMADVEAAEHKEPCKYTFEIEKEEDMKVRVVKSAAATVKIPHITTITPGETSTGYITNIEGLLNRIKHVLESTKEESEDEEDKKKLKNMLKKLQRVMWGQEKLKVIIEDPSGNSAIISERSKKEKLK